MATSDRTPASPLDQPISNLRRAIRASTSLAASGVKRPAEVIQCVSDIAPSHPKWPSYDIRCLGHNIHNPSALVQHNNSNGWLQVVGCASLSKICRSTEARVSSV